MRLTRRRSFLAGVLSLALPPEAWSQARVPRIGVLEFGSPEGFPLRVAAFRRGLAEQGYVEGRDLIVEYRWANGSSARLHRLAEELAAMQLDAIFAPTTVSALAARKATATTPIVFAVAADPIGAKLIASLARPGGNATGLTTLNVEVAPKRLELLKEISGASVVGLLYNPVDPSNVIFADSVESAGEKLGVRTRRLLLRSAEDLIPVFASLATERIGGLLVAAGAMIDGQRARIAALAAQARVPAVYGAPEFVEAGGLASYSASFTDNYRRAASYVSRILKGAKPAELAVEQASEFELVLNLKAASALGLSISQSLRMRATRVIE